MQSGKTTRATSRSLLSLILSLIVVNAQAAPDAGSLMKEQENARHQLPSKLPELEDEVSEPALEEVKGEVISIKAIRFTGATKLVPLADLERLVADTVGKSYTFSQLNQVAQRVTDYLKSKGFLLARAYLPQQDVTEGQIEIFILQGRLDGAGDAGYEVVPQAGKTLRIKPKVLSGIGAATLRAGEPLKTESLERAVLLMNDLPGITARARLEPGSKADTTHVLLDVSEKPVVGLAAWVDNYGSDSTGITRTNASVILRDPLRIGDQFELSGTHSTGVDLWRVAFSRPIGSSGLRIGTDFTNMDYTLSGGVASDTKLEGDSQARSINISYPFVRSRFKNLYGNLGFAHKAFKNMSAGAVTSDKRDDVWTIGLSGDAFDYMGGGGQMFGSLGLAFGDMDLSHNASNERDDSLTYRTSGDFAKLHYGLARLQKLPGNFTAYAGVSGQVASKNLDSSEKFYLGGPSSLRAYPGGEAGGDNGWLANFEVRYDLPTTKLGQSRLTGFYDVGGITMNKNTNNISIDTATGDNKYTLSGIGVSAEISKNELYQLRMVLARKLGSNPGRTTEGMNADGDNQDSQFWIQGTLWY